MEISCYCVVSNGATTVRAQTVVTGKMTPDKEEDCLNNNTTSYPKSAKRPRMDDTAQEKELGDGITEKLNTR